MRVILTVIAGPHKGLEFTFDKHDTFLVGRSKHAHFQLPAGDKFFSRIHFMLEINPPQCRLIDMGSHNGTFVNGQKVLDADLKAGDQIRAGHTVLTVKVAQDANADTVTVHRRELTGPLPTVPGYTLLREIGRGSMGVTYFGHRNGDATPRAIKVVQPSTQGAESQVDDFLVTARALTQVEHPNIVRLREAGICPAGLFFASHFVAGSNATQLVQREKPLSVERVLHLGLQMLQALQHAHASHFVHRGIKPSNVIVGESNGAEVAYLTDYALAYVYQKAPFSGLSLTSDLLSIASYIPPEVLFNYKQVGPQADQYSTAAVLYYLLTGEPALDLPKEENRRYSTLLRRQYVPMRERRPDIPEAVTAVIHKALNRLPAQRYANVAEFAQAVRQLV